MCVPLAKETNEGEKRMFVYLFTTHHNHPTAASPCQKGTNPLRVVVQISLLCVGWRTFFFFFFLTLLDVAGRNQLLSFDQRCQLLITQQWRHFTDAVACIITARHHGATESLHLALPKVSQKQARRDRRVHAAVPAILDWRKLVFSLDEHHCHRVIGVRGAVQHGLLKLPTIGDQWRDELSVVVDVRDLLLGNVVVHQRWVVCHFLHEPECKEQVENVGCVEQQLPCFLVP